jgi:benzoyl-CoA reductase/2-hydroxyglutaryl-CoA dehydratase subunit BcrC/BadD/HgdB
MEQVNPEFDDENLSHNISRTIANQIEYLEKNNGGIKSLKYFYTIFNELFGNRIRELKHQKENGKKIIGVFCNFVPEELIIASNCVPVRLCLGSIEPILRSEEIVPRNFCPLIKSSLGSSMMGSPVFDLLDTVIVPTTCDGKKKLAEILVERMPTWVMEVPHTNETPQARQHWFFEVQVLKKKLEKLTKNKITIKKLKSAIELTNRKRRVLRKLYYLRKQNPPPIWGRDALLVTNLAIYDDISRWTAQVETLCNELVNLKPINNSSSPRIMLTGSPVVFPTWKIPILTEESGGVIVIDDICTGSKELWDHIEPANWSMTGMLVGIADKYLMNTCACFTPNLNRRDRIIQYINDFNVDGVIYHTLQGCHIYGLEQHRIEKALTQIKIPRLCIETDYSEEDVEQIRTRLEAFIEMISNRSIKSGTQPSIQNDPITI